MQTGNLEAFVQTAKNGSVSRAAEALFLSQPAITSRLHALEAELGEKLFVRERHGVRLTEAGEALLPFAENALHALIDGAIALRAHREGLTGTVIIGSSSVLGIHYLPDRVAAIMEQHPGIRLVIRTGHTTEVLQRVLNRDVHLGIGYAIPHPDIDSTSLGTDELVLAVPADHPLAGAPTVSPTRLTQEKLIVLGSPTYFETLTQIFLAAKTTPRAVIEIDNAEAAKRLVKRGLGAAVLHRSTISEELADGTLAAVTLEGGLGARPLALFTRRGATVGPAARAVIDCLVGPR